MQVAAQRTALTVEPQFYGTDKARVDRYIAALLPFKQETVESWGNHTLGDCRQAALSAAEVTKRFAALKSSQTLDSVLASVAPAQGMLDRLKSRLGMSAAQREALVRHLQGELETVLRDVRGLAPNATDEGKRLAALLLALRSVAQACGTPASSTFELILEQRLGTLRSALTQINLVPAQLKALEDTASLQLAQCGRLLNVTLPAARLAEGR